ncbi:dihydrolipoyl dehydrogenase [Candidatus Micrarchaeota archaeon]|nr:dihydrolipoyl dehydrogenase [Candidatus Micrarchaeota archaeon]
MVEKFDLIVIGAGSGLDIVSAASSKGLKVALIEKGPMGGTCLNRGCIPSKMIIHSADLMQEIKRAHLFGLKVGKVKIDFAKITDRANNAVDKDAQEIEESIRKSKNITLFKGTGKFIGPKTLDIGGKQLTSDKIVIGAGTRPSIPPIEGLDTVPYMTSDEALRLRKLPKHLIIVGGGYIACELAHFFGSMGSSITILQRNVRLLPDEDEEVSLKFTELFSKQYDVKLGFTVKKVEKIKNKIIVRSDREKVEGTDLLIATGRIPNSDILDVSKTNVLTNKAGFVETNDYLQTNVPGIYAFGDIAGKYLFKHSANLEAEYVTYNMFNENNLKKVDYTGMPHAVFSYPQVAGVGATEQELKEKKIDYLVGKYKYIDSGMGLAIEDQDGFVKFLTDYQGKILGCHIMGHEASTLIHEVLVSIKAGKGHVNDIIDTIHIHPALSEVVQRGAGSV